MLPLQIIEPRLQKLIIIHIPQLHPPALPLHLPENLIRVIMVLPIQGAVLHGGDPAGRGDLRDIDVRQIVFRVFGDGEGDCRERDGAPVEPAYALLCLRMRVNKQLFVSLSLSPIPCAGGVKVKTHGFGMRRLEGDVTIWSIRSVSSDRVLFWKRAGYPSVGTVLRGLVP